MAVPKSTKRYTSCLFFVNGLMSVIGITMVILGMLLRYEDQGQGTSLLLPDWMLSLMIAFGAVVLAISMLGCIGTWNAAKKIELGLANWPLRFYFLVLFISFTVQMTAFVVLLDNAVIMDEVAGETQATSSSVRSAESRWVNNLRERPKEWREVQNFFECCGWYNQRNPALCCDKFAPYWNAVTETYNPKCDCCPLDCEFGDPMATGDFCVAPADQTATSCRQKLIDETNERLVPLIAVVSVYIVSLMGALISAYCLGYCIRDDSYFHKDDQTKKGKTKK